METSLTVPLLLNTQCIIITAIRQSLSVKASLFMQNDRNVFSITRIHGVENLRRLENISLSKVNSLYMYTVRHKNTHPQKFFNHNLKKGYPILIICVLIFMTQLVIKWPFSFPPLPTSAFALPGENKTSKILHFYSMQYHYLIIKIMNIWHIFPKFLALWLRVCQIV